MREYVKQVEVNKEGLENEFHRAENKLHSAQEQVQKAQGILASEKKQN